MALARVTRRFVQGWAIAALGAACVGEIGPIARRGDGPGAAGIPGADGGTLPDDGLDGAGGDEPDAVCPHAEPPPVDASQTPPPVLETTRGFFTDAFELSIRSELPGASIFYTLDGSAPGPDNGAEAASPATIAIGTTSIVRAVAVAEGLAPSRIETHTYLFLADVLRQSAHAAGVP